MVGPGDAVSISKTLACRRRSEMARLSGDLAINNDNSKGTLVLIEPDESVRDALTILLQGEGWQVDALGDCNELAGAIERPAVVAVISEASLPLCTPQEIFEQSAKRELPVIFTGHDLPLQGAVDLIRLGAMDFLDKPFPQARLLDLLERLHTRQNG